MLVAIRRIIAEDGQPVRHHRGRLDTGNTELSVEPMASVIFA
jgi:hypothetical protein